VDVLLDSTVPDVNGAIGMGRDVWLVGDQHDGIAV
jgi:hypothetical protein